MSRLEVDASRRKRLHRLYRLLRHDKAFSFVREEGDGVFVPGDGPVRPRLMFIGEAPGAREAKLRKPFVGASGELLNEMLASVGIDREQVFITNVVKFHPKDNRDPTDAEVHAAYPYLRAEHRILGSPPMVVLGRHAKNALTGSLSGVSIGEWVWMVRGDGSGYPLLPLHHPAYGIYQRANRPMMFKQFQAVLSPPTSAEEAR